MKFTGFIGVIFLLGIAYILSNNRRAIKPRTVFWGIGLQLLFAVVILKIPLVKNQFSKIDNIFVNQGPGKYSSIRSAISVVKALKITKNINIYGYYSTQISNNDYNILLKLLKEGRLTKNFIQPKY